MIIMALWYLRLFSAMIPDYKFNPTLIFQIVTEIWIGTKTSYKRMNIKIPFAKCRSFCLVFNWVADTFRCRYDTLTHRPSRPLARDWVPVILRRHHGFRWTTSIILCNISTFPPDYQCAYYVLIWPRGLPIHEMDTSHLTENLVQ